MNVVPVLAIVGRPNVGKSTLFNRLTRTRDALVASVAGLTRDRNYGEAEFEGRRFIVIDTGGVGEDHSDLTELMTLQVKQALQEADVILFVVDTRAGVTAADLTIAIQCRQTNKPCYLVCNKVDDLDVNVACAEFHSLGLGEPQPIAAVHGRGIHSLLTNCLPTIVDEMAAAIEPPPGIKIAIIGRPNVGKSTLVNRMLGEERVIVYDLPGTTRDSIYIPFERHGKHYVVIDTAGVRRRGKVKLTVEKFSVIKTLRAIEAANVAIVVIDAQEGVTEQDLHLIGYVLEAGRSIIIAVNKWDGLTQEQRQKVNKTLARRLNFLDFAPQKMISALHGTGVGELFAEIQRVYAAANKTMTTSGLTRLLQQAVKEHEPPLVRGRRVKLRYAHAGGHNPPVIVIHGTQTASLPKSYQRYLIKYFREALKLVGTPVKLELKTSENPYKDKRNTLTPLQEYKHKQQQKKRK